ncbi:MAG: OLD family endonuclease [Rhizobiales bacterium 24-66-13]|jgi:putative ATP-dependent endonuclease of OLD family|nr:MAG: OLD family endonuclease [Rhizobiales bacterium 35-66-30]OYZ82566.1 MAG: OLD family endonuclease [Rhizobiales bacterium 24-66-13]OZB11510.1 MAG: OLD family endonuclease [Rhizobiales bacterium 39-66-18]HQS07312.1 ATP-binding protein [Xanthobacteraceae bacterium]HQS45474.1 ATP-binding protein [Xanthobacteraceae bacterium]
MTDTAPSAKPPAAAIYALTIERFRGITSLKWKPSRGVNVILGGGDVGKTTILEAIALLFSPVNPTTLSDPDYHDRDIEAGFSIEAVLSLPVGAGMSSQMKPSWPWEWSGEEAAVPALEHDGKLAGEPVYRVRVRGTEDLELAYEIVQPDGSADSFPVALRRAIGLVRLSGDDRNDRDLRLVQGSALDRLLSDKGLRSRMASELAKNDVKNELTTEAQAKLKNLDTAFKRESLPAGLDLAITGGQGASIASMIGLTADRSGIQLPLASWGAGTRRLSALAIAEQNQGDAPITLVDEVERGLEPYRQRTLIEKLQTGSSQVFLTTHSPAAISSAATSSIWYVDHTGQIGPLDATKIAKHRKTDPEAFLSRLAIVAEGATELGFTTAILERAFGSVLEQHGVHVSDGGGHEATLGILEALAAGGLRFGGFADDEGKHPTRWAKLHTKLGGLLFRWPSLCIEENIIAVVPDDKLEAFIADPAGEKTGIRLRTLADRLGIAEKDFAALRARAGADFRARIVEAALGTVPTGKESDKNEYKAHAGQWFKSVDGGRELAGKLFSLALWPALKPQLLPFCNAVRTAIGLTEIADLHG